MSDWRLRQRIAVDAARLMYEGTIKEYFTAKRKAATRHGADARYAPKDLPSNREIRDEILKLARLYEGEGRTARLGDMRRYALSVMRLLRRFHPKLIGSVCTGHIRKESDVDVHVFSDSIASITSLLDDERLAYESEHKTVVKHGERRVFTHIHVHGEHEVEITVYAADKVNYPFKSSITGDVIEALTIPELEEVLRKEHPEVEPGEIADPEGGEARLRLFEALLRGVEGLDGGPRHPEGDVLFHSLQVFELARLEHPYDIEMAEAALLHDVGKGLDPEDHAAAAAEAIEGHVSERVHFLVAHHMDALRLRQGRLGGGSRTGKRLRASPWFQDLMALRSLDDRGRRPGVWVPSLEEALDHLAEWGGTESAESGESGESGERAEGW